MALTGVRVLDLSRLLPGAYCTQLLEAQGAAVTKVESPGGDPIRMLPAGETYFDALHRGQPLLTLDLRTADGRASLRGRVADADVLVEGFRPGVMERYGARIRLALGDQSGADLLRHHRVRLERSTGPTG